jgi:hypothetical protein
MLLGGHMVHIDIKLIMPSGIPNIAAGLSRIGLARSFSQRLVTTSPVLSR